MNAASTDAKQGGVVIRPDFRFKGRRPRPEGPRMNERIRIPEIRLIDHDGSQLGVFITSEALRRARELGLDLVEISPMAKPPVCKIMDYGKHKYEESKKKHERKKKQTVVVVKEIKLRPSTDEHDFQTKLRHVRRFLETNNKVKVSIRFRGREMAHVDLGMAKMKKITEEIKEFGEVESYPKMEGRQMMMILSPTKKVAQKAISNEAAKNKAKDKAKEKAKEKDVERKDTKTNQKKE